MIYDSMTFMGDVQYTCRMPAIICHGSRSLNPDMNSIVGTAGKRRHPKRNHYKLEKIVLVAKGAAGKQCGLRSLKG